MLLSGQSFRKTSNFSPRRRYSFPTFTICISEHSPLIVSHNHSHLCLVHLFPIGLRLLLPQTPRATSQEGVTILRALLDKMQLRTKFVSIDGYIQPAITRFFLFSLDRRSLIALLRCFLPRYSPLSNTQARNDCFAAKTTGCASEGGCFAVDHPDTLLSSLLVPRAIMTVPSSPRCHHPLSPESSRLDNR